MRTDLIERHFLLWQFGMTLSIVLGLCLNSVDTYALWQKNLVHLGLVRAIHGENITLIEKAESQISGWDRDDCQREWLLGTIRNSLGNLQQRNMYWMSALQCSPKYLSFINAVLPENLSLAREAVRIYPERADAWFLLGGVLFADAPAESIDAYAKGLRYQPKNAYVWVQIGKALAALNARDAWRVYEEQGFDQLAVGDSILGAEVQFVMAAALSKSQPERAVQLYKAGLQIKPHDGIRWYELGDLLRSHDPRAAIDAYLQSCYNGDPGNHGCYGAGLLAEKFGNIQEAITYYRFSKWETARNRAAQLEKALP